MCQFFFPPIKDLIYIAEKQLSRMNSLDFLLPVDGRQISRPDSGAKVTETQRHRSGYCTVTGEGRLRDEGIAATLFTKKDLGGKEKTAHSHEKSNRIHFRK